MYLSNNITFNGVITGDFIDVGGGYVAVPLEGLDKSKFPIVLVTAKIEDVKKALSVGQHITAGGKLEFMDDNWVIVSKYMSVIPPNEEIEEAQKKAMEKMNEKEKKLNEQIKTIEKSEKENKRLPLTKAKKGITMTEKVRNLDDDKKKS